MAVLECCETGHTWTSPSEGTTSFGFAKTDENIISNVYCAIAYCDYAASTFIGADGPIDRAALYAAAADKLRDFATVELLCKGLGITQKELK